MCEQVTSSINSASESFMKSAIATSKIVISTMALIKSMLDLYPNKRVKYLAFNGHGRTKKKNLNRIKKYLMKNIKSGGKY